MYLRRCKPLRPLAADSALFYGLLVLLAWAPLPWGSNAPWGRNLLCIAAFGLMLGWLVLLGLGKTQISTPCRKAGAALALLLGLQAWTLVQLIPLPLDTVATLSPNTAAMYQPVTGPQGYVPLSLAPIATRQAVLLGLAYCALFFVSLNLLNSARRIRLLCSVAIASGLLQACYGGFMVLSGQEASFFVVKEAHLGKATGTFLNSNHYANFLTQCLALGIGLLVADTRSRRSLNWRQAMRAWLALLLSPKARLRLYLAIMVVGLVLSVSRMGNISFFISLGLAGTLVIATGKAKRGLRRGALALFASLLLVDLLIVGQWFGFDAVVERLERTEIEHEARSDVWLAAKEMAADYPLAGTGAGSFAVAFPRYRSQEIRHFYYSAENDYLEFVTDLGVGACLPLAAGAISLWAAIGALRRRRDPLLRAMGFSSAMAIIAMASHALFDFNLRIPANASWLMVLMALAWIAAYQPRSKIAATRRASDGASLPPDSSL